MSGDFSRSTFDPRKHYAGVRMQQGRVQLDADWNEQVDIVDDAIRARTLDILGWSGGPEGTAGFELSAHQTLVFGGRGDFVEAPARKEYALRERDHVTIEAVIAPRAGGAGGPIFSAGHLLLSLEDGGSLCFRHGGADVAVTTRRLTWDRPRHVVVAYDGDSTRIHVDGEEVASSKASRSGAGAGDPHIEIVELREEIDLVGGAEVALFAPTPHRQHGVPLRIGGTRAGAAESFDGAIRSVRVWKTAVPARDVRALATRASADDPHLIASFRLDDGFGHRARDLSPLRNDADLKGPEGRRPVWRLDELRIGAGRYYVGGILCENEGAVSFEAQSDLPGEACPGQDGIYLAVLDVWERVVTALEDPGLREVALGGPDTAVRTKVVWQVRLLRPPPGDHDRETAHAWRALAESTAGAGTMRARCQLGAKGEITGNRLYRVEIHDEGEASGSPFPEHGSWLEVTAVPGDATAVQAHAIDDPSRWTAGRWVELEGRGGPLLTQLAGAPRVTGKVTRFTLAKPLGDGAGRLRMRLVATYKWSRNNGLDALPVRAIEAVPATAATKATTAVTLLEPVGHYGATLREGDWVEILGERELRRGDPAPVAKIQSIGDDHRTLTLTTEVPWDAALNRPALVRRWDRDPGAPDQGVSPVTTGWNELEQGIAVQFSGSGLYHTGHHWFLPARAQLRGIEWPEDLAGPAACAPRGGHHFARLALLRKGEDGVQIEDLRRTFVPLARFGAPGAELRGPITVQGSLHVTGEVIVDDAARARWVAGELPIDSIETPQLVDHAVTAPKLAAHAVHARHLAEGVGFVPDGFAILGSSPISPPGFVYAHQQIEVHNPRPEWKGEPALPAAEGGRVVLVTVDEALYALCEHDRAILRHDEAGARWVKVGAMSAHRRGFGAAATGRTIHIVGGLDEHGLARADHEVFDTEAGGTAQPARGQLSRARARLGVAAVGDLVVAVGGVEGFLPWRVRDLLIGLGLPRTLFSPRLSSDAVEVYDPRRQRWHSLASMPTARSDFGLGVLHDRVHVVGGRSQGLFGGAEILREHEAFALARGLWETRMPLGTPRAELGAAIVEGRLYVTGGLGPDGALSTVEAYTPLGDAWHAAAKLHSPRHDHGSSGLFGDVFVVGGRTSRARLGSAESCPMASTLFLHRKGAPGDGGAVAELSGPAPKHALPAHRDPATLAATRLTRADLLRRVLVLAAVLGLLAALVYGYSPGEAGRVPAAHGSAAPSARAP